jgi:hypothetical protein
MMANNVSMSRESRIRNPKSIEQYINPLKPVIAREGALHIAAKRGHRQTISAAPAAVMTHEGPS